MTFDLDVVAVGCTAFAVLMCTRPGRAAAIRMYVEPCLRVITGRYRPSPAKIKELENRLTKS